MSFNRISDLPGAVTPNSWDDHRDTYALGSVKKVLKGEEVSLLHGAPGLGNEFVPYVIVIERFKQKRKYNENKQWMQEYSVYVEGSREITKYLRSGNNFENAMLSIVQSYLLDINIKPEVVQENLKPVDDGLERLANSGDGWAGFMQSYEDLKQMLLQNESSTDVSRALKIARNKVSFERISEREFARASKIVKGEERSISADIDTKSYRKLMSRLESNNPFLDEEKGSRRANRRLFDHYVPGSLRLPTFLNDGQGGLVRRPVDLIDAEDMEDGLVRVPTLQDEKREEVRKQVYIGRDANAANAYIITANKLDFEVLYELKEIEIDFNESGRTRSRLRKMTHVNDVPYLVDRRNLLPPELQVTVTVIFDRVQLARQKFELKTRKPLSAEDLKKVDEILNYRPDAPELPRGYEKWILNQNSGPVPSELPKGYERWFNNKEAGPIAVVKALQATKKWVTAHDAWIFSLINEELLMPAEKEQEGERIKEPVIFKEDVEKEARRLQTIRQQVVGLDREQANLKY